MSIDNLFIFLPDLHELRAGYHCQRRVLNYGIFGVVILRLIFILLGATIVNLFHWVLYLWAPSLYTAGFKVFKKSDAEEVKDYRNSRLFRAVGRILPMSEELNGRRFFVRKKQRSVRHSPARHRGPDRVVRHHVRDRFRPRRLFSITTNVFLVYTSNIFRDSSA
jgi:tellurite resistance protein TerC